MKALSIRQPWAHFVAAGIKPVENRDWQPINSGLKFRGKFLIHTGKVLDKDAFIDITHIGLDMEKPLDIPADFPLGGIIGMAEVVDVVTDHPSPWFFGPLALVIANAKPLPFRPYKGQLGFFDVNHTELYTPEELA